MVWIKRIVVTRRHTSNLRFYPSAVNYRAVVLWNNHLLNIHTIFIIKFNTTSNQSPNPIFFFIKFWSKIIQASNIGGNNTRLTSKKQVSSFLIRSFFCFVMGNYVSYVELYHGKTRQLTAEEYLISVMSRKISVVRYRGILVKKFHNDAIFSKKNSLVFFFLFFFF